MKCPHCGHTLGKNYQANLEWLAFLDRRELERLNEIDARIERILLDYRALHSKIKGWKIPEEQKVEQAKLREERRKLKWRAQRRARKTIGMADCPAQPPIRFPA